MNASHIIDDRYVPTALFIAYLLAISKTAAFHKLFSNIIHLSLTLSFSLFLCLAGFRHASTWHIISHHRVHLSFQWEKVRFGHEINNFFMKKIQ